jgi:hypothetical protein
MKAATPLHITKADTPWVQHICEGTLRGFVTKSGIVRWDGQMLLFVDDNTGREGQITRQCSREHKVRPIRSLQPKLMVYRPGAEDPGRLRQDRDRLQHRRGPARRAGRGQVQRAHLSPDHPRLYRLEARDLADVGRSGQVGRMPSPCRLGRHGDQHPSVCGCRRRQLRRDQRLDFESGEAGPNAAVRVRIPLWDRTI